MPTPLATLRTSLAELSDLATIQQNIHWDHQVVMPPRGASLRAEQLATMERVLHERATAPELGTLLARAASEVEGRDEGDDDAAIVRVAQRDYDKAVRVPADLRAGLARAGALGHTAWLEARARGDWSIFAPHLEGILELKRRYVDCFPEVDEPYDALLDDYEPHMRSSQVRALFAELKAGLVPLVRAIGERAGPDDGSLMHAAGAFPRARQEALVRSVVERVGFDPDGWRLDVAVHPFALGLGTRDIRITTRYDEDYLGMALYGALHETGHGLYEEGSAPSLERTTLAGGVSLGVHESQSRLWENNVGRSRPFMDFLLPRLREAFPERFGAVDGDALYRAVNVVAPSLIRVEADEVTYGLHIIIRFELEQEMLAGTIAIDDLPDAWNARYHEYLGVEVPDLLHGVLQDVHWSEGILGYFPTYQLGNVIAAQLAARAHTDLDGFDALVAAGDFAPLLAWLREHVHRGGRKLPPVETIERAIGGPLDVNVFLDYLRAKFGPIYGLEPGALG
jgi:carboxypeptidase Taq